MSSNLANLLFIYGAHVTIYIGNDSYVFRNWPSSSSNAVVAMHFDSLDKLVSQFTYYNANELSALLSVLFSHADYRYGEYMNWARNQTYQKFTRPSELE